LSSYQLINENILCVPAVKRPKKWRGAGFRKKEGRSSFADRLLRREEATEDRGIKKGLKNGEEPGFGKRRGESLLKAHSLF